MGLDLCDYGTVLTSLHVSKGTILRAEVHPSTPTLKQGKRQAYIKISINLHLQDD